MVTIEEIATLIANANQNDNPTELILASLDKNVRDKILEILNPNWEEDLEGLRLVRQKNEKLFKQHRKGEALKKQNCPRRKAIEDKLSLTYFDKELFVNIVIQGNDHNKKELINFKPSAEQLAQLVDNVGNRILPIVEKLGKETEMSRLFLNALLKELEERKNVDTAQRVQWETDKYHYLIDEKDEKSSSILEEIEELKDEIYFGLYDEE